MRRRRESIHPGRNPDPDAFLPLPHLPYQILVALAEAPRHGWGIVKRVEGLSGGLAKPSSGSLYLAIARLEERGLIGSAQGTDAVGGSRTIYTIAPLGRQVLALETTRLRELLAQATRSLAAPGD